jgi:hypothetical protein
MFVLSLRYRDIWCPHVDEFYVLNFAGTEMLVENLTGGLVSYEHMKVVELLGVSQQFRQLIGSVAVMVNDEGVIFRSEGVGLKGRELELVLNIKLNDLLRNLFFKLFLWLSNVKSEVSEESRYLCRISSYEQLPIITHYLILS